MNREIKFKFWLGHIGKMTYEHTLSEVHKIIPEFSEDIIPLQFVGIKDKNKVDIFEGDVLEFADKWEWYKTSYGIKMRFAEPERRAELQKQYDAEPMERRVIEMPECYEWLLSSEIQTYWHVVGNIYSNPELVSKEAVPNC